jgi:hypothetical protein
MLPLVASDALYLLRDHLKIFIFTHYSYKTPFLRHHHPIPTLLHYVMTSLHPLSGIVPISGNEWDIDLPVFYTLGWRIHCNTILSFRNTIVSSNIASSQHSPFRNHFDESTMLSSFTKKFFQILVERLKIMNW